MGTIELSVAEFGAWQQKTASLNARARKRGWSGRLALTGRQVTVVNAGAPPRFPHYPYGAEVVRVEAALQGEPPRYGGWTLLARLDALPAEDGSAGWVVRCAPGVEESLVDRELLRPGWCDHCRTRRPGRRRLYAVRHAESGQTLQVGSTCLKDFTGWSTAPVFVSTEEVVEQLGAGGVGQDAFTPGYVLGVAIAAVDSVGWVPRSASGERGPATADLVLDFLVGTGESGRGARRLLEPVLPAALDQAEAVTATVLAGLGSEGGGYAANLCAVLQAESVSVREVALLASAPSAYRRLLGRQEVRATPPERAWLGAPGDRVEVAGTVQTALTVDGYAYGTTQRLIVVDAGETLAKTCTGAAWSYDVEPGDRVRLAATVKAHETYREQRQTVLVRPKRLPNEAV